MTTISNSKMEIYKQTAKIFDEIVERGKAVYELKKKYHKMGFYCESYFGFSLTDEGIEITVEEDIQGTCERFFKTYLITYTELLSETHDLIDRYTEEQHQYNLKLKQEMETREAVSKRNIELIEQKEYERLKKKYGRL